MKAILRCGLGVLINACAQARGKKGLWLGSFLLGQKPACGVLCPSLGAFAWSLPAQLQGQSRCRCVVSDCWLFKMDGKRSMNPLFLLSRGHISGVIGQAEGVGVLFWGGGREVERIVHGAGSSKAKRDIFAYRCSMIDVRCSFERAVESSRDRLIALLERSGTRVGVRRLLLKMGEHVDCFAGDKRPRLCETRKNSFFFPRRCTSAMACQLCIRYSCLFLLLFLQATASLLSLSSVQPSQRSFSFS